MGRLHSTRKKHLLKHSDGSGEKIMDIVLCSTEEAITRMPGISML